MRAEGSNRRGWRRWLVIATLALGGMLAMPASAAAATYPDAVLLVSGFDTASPFTTPDPTCDGKEGPEWDPVGGIAKTLKPAGLDVFTAPVRQTGEPLLPPCFGAGELVPPDTAVINSNGETDANGKALANLIGFLRDAYGVERLQIVGHSDGGLWSRSAITQDGAYTGVEVRSLTTLGTPHTGSLVADLAIQLSGGQCDFSNEIEQLICDGVVDVAQLMLKDLGQVATSELTNGFLTGWNPKQRIGSCPVTGIAGDAVGVNFPGLEYYTPNDGAVGLASALGEASKNIDGSRIPAPGIPGFRQGGTYDVVHGEVVSFISAQNLLNTQAISDEVRDTVIANATNMTPCNLGAGEREPGATRLGLPLYRLDAPNRQGRLPRPDDGEYVAARRGVRVSCGRDTSLEPTVYRGDRRIQFFGTFDCDRHLRVTRSGGNETTARGKASRGGGAVLLDHAERNRVILEVEGAEVRIKVRGAKTRNLRVTAWAGGRRKRLTLDRKGRATLPHAENRTRLRIRARTKPGWVASTATTTISR